MVRLEQALAVTHELVIQRQSRHELRLGPAETPERQVESSAHQPQPLRFAQVLQLAPAPQGSGGAHSATVESQSPQLPSRTLRHEPSSRHQSQSLRLLQLSQLRRVLHGVAQSVTR